MNVLHMYCLVCTHMYTLYHNVIWVFSPSPSSDDVKETDSVSRPTDLDQVFAVHLQQIRTYDIHTSAISIVTDQLL